MTIAVPQAGNQSAGVQITDENNIKGTTTVSYYETDGNGNRGEALGSVPTAVDEHWEEITVGEGAYSATAHLVYDVVAVVSLGDKTYSTFLEAINEVADGEAIELLADLNGIFTFNKCGVTVTLDLNGHTIDGNKQVTVFSIQNGTFILDDNSADKSGCITGVKTAGKGSGVSVTSGTFTMEGGTIQYNEGYSNTGGVLVMANGFTMSGGTIQYNEGLNFCDIGSMRRLNFSSTAVVKDNVIKNPTAGLITKTETGYTLAEDGTP